METKTIVTVIYLAMLAVFTVLIVVGTKWIVRARELIIVLRELSDSYLRELEIIRGYSVGLKKQIDEINRLHDEALHEKLSSEELNHANVEE